MTGTAGSDSLTTLIDTAPAWRSWQGVHGGYLVARAAADGQTLAPGLPLRAVHAMFTRPVTASSSTMTVEIVSKGRLTTNLAAEVTPDDRLGVALRMQMLLGAGGAGGAAPVVDSRPAPVVPAVDQCEPFSLPADLVPFGQNLEIRPATEARPLAGGNVAELTAWIRFLLPGLTPTATFLVLVDALPPALYGVMTTPVPIPTAELAVHLTSDADRAEPSAWYLVRICTEAARDGWSLEGSSVWDADGRLMALGRQARRVIS
jgi:acyl-CoA thioesterase